MATGEHPRKSARHEIRVRELGVGDGTVLEIGTRATAARPYDESCEPNLS